MPVGEIVERLPIGRSAVSHHLRILVEGEAGAVMDLVPTEAGRTAF